MALKAKPKVGTEVLWGSIRAKVVPDHHATKDKDGTARIQYEDSFSRVRHTRAVPLKELKKAPKL